jgi:hypothetical protein
LLAQKETRCPSIHLRMAAMRDPAVADAIEAVHSDVPRFATAEAMCEANLVAIAAGRRARRSRRRRSS